MKFLNQCKTDEKFIYFPIFDSSEFVKFSWNEDESFEDALKRNGSKFRHYYHSWKCLNYLELDFSGEFESKVDHIFVYQIKSEFNGNEYFLVSIWEIDGENFENCFCLPKNEFNLFLFYKEFIKPLRD